MTNIARNYCKWFRERNNRLARLLLARTSSIRTKNHVIGSIYMHVLEDETSYFFLFLFFLQTESYHILFTVSMESSQFLSKKEGRQLGTWQRKTIKKSYKIAPQQELIRLEEQLQHSSEQAHQIFGVCLAVSNHSS